MHCLKSLPSGAPDDCLSLSDALYCVNYVRSIRYENPASVYVSHDSFVDAQVTTTTVFGDGTPCNAWLANHDHTLPLHDSSEDYFSGDGCPAWAIRMQQLDSEATDIETIYVNALTGDLYNDTNSGGYVPSPFMERSMYSRVLNAIWCCQPALSSVYPAFPFVFADETVVGFDRISVTTDVGALVGMNANAPYCQGKAPNFAVGETVCWHPLLGNANDEFVNKFDDGAIISFTLYSGKDALGSGTIRIYAVDDPTDSFYRTYTARLSSDYNIHLENNSADWGGGLVRCRLQK